MHRIPLMPTNFKEPMARWSIKEWAVRLVGDLVSKEAELMASKDGDLLLKSLSRKFVGQTTEVIEPGRMVEKGLRDRSFSIPSGTEHQLYSSRLDQGDGIADVTVEYNRKYYWTIQGHRGYQTRRKR